MHRLLIVDDEPYIADSLAEMMASSDFDLDIYKAYNGTQAMELVSARKMDIVLTDIEMPDLTGLELQEEIRRLWPDTQIIFLTGYDYFDYIQTAVRGGGVDYLLKTEGEAVIMEAMRKTIEALEKRNERERSLQEARLQRNAASPLLRKEYFMQLLSGRKTTAAAMEEQFRKLDIPLLASQPVMMAVGRVDDWREGYSAYDRALILYSIENIAEEYLQPVARVQTLSVDYSRIVCLMQPREDADHPVSRMHDLMDSIQSTCRKLLDVTISLSVSKSPAGWGHIGEMYSQLVFLLNRGIGLGRESLLVWSGDESESEPYGAGRHEVRGGLLDGLEDALEKGDREAFMKLFHELSEWYMDAAEEDAAHYEIHCRLAAMLFSHCRRLGNAAPQHMPRELRELTDVRSRDKRERWNALSDCFRELFRHREQDQDSVSHHLIRRLHDHIHNHLDGDLTLQALSEVVHLNPYYLSRLYKQYTGNSLNSYIVEKRLEKALHLLKSSNLQVQEIAAQVGFESNAYFTRFFKKKMKMTPLEYRGMTLKS